MEKILPLRLAHSRNQAASLCNDTRDDLAIKAVTFVKSHGMMSFISQSLIYLFLIIYWIMFNACMELSSYDRHLILGSCPFLDTFNFPSLFLAPSRLNAQCF
jgi:hypothetical protein